MRFRGGAVALAAMTTMTMTALAGGPRLGGFGPGEASAFGVDLEPAPSRAFPLLAKPEYGDGLGAGRGHEGADMFAPAGTPEVAVADGIVLEAAAGYNGGRGNYVSVYDPARNRTYNYFHMIAPPLVASGDRVRAGRKLGELGCSGSCWGEHLHFELRSGRDPYGPVLDPLPFLESLGRIGRPA